MYTQYKLTRVLEYEFDAMALVTQLCTAGAAIVGSALVCISIMCALAPQAASNTYGVPSSDVAWVSATGVRDFSLGFAVLALLRANNVEALRVMIASLFFVAAGDTCIVLRFGSGGVSAAAPHLLGVLALLVGSVLFRIADNDKSAKQKKRSA